MVLTGRVNKGLVDLIQKAGGKAVGICGKDGGMIKARQRTELDIGLVGEVLGVDPALVASLVSGGYIPVIATVAADDVGNALNINADTAAGEVGGR